MTEGLCDYFVTVGSLDTIGVYGFTGEAFIAALEGAGVGLVLDVRQRRGVRGSEYSWANSVRLQARLAQAGIEYRHHKELAPTTELRRLQYRADDAAGVGKRSRRQLAPEYVEGYLAQVLDRVDLGALAATLPPTRSARCSASSATPRPATARWWPTGWRPSSACRCATCCRTQPSNRVERVWRSAARRAPAGEG